MVAERVVVERQRAGGQPGPGDALGGEVGGEAVGLEGRALVDAVARVDLRDQPRLDPAPAGPEARQHGGVDRDAGPLHAGGRGHVAAAEQRLAERGARHRAGGRGWPAACAAGVRRARQRRLGSSRGSPGARPPTTARRAGRGRASRSSRRRPWRRGRATAARRAGPRRTGVGSPLVVARNSANRSRIRAGIGQPSARKQPSSARGVVGHEQRLGADVERRPAQCQQLVAPEPQQPAGSQLARDHAHRLGPLAVGRDELEVDRPDLPVGQPCQHVDRTKGRRIAPPALGKVASVASRAISPASWRRSRAPKHRRQGRKSGAGARFRDSRPACRGTGRCPSGTATKGR